MREDEARVLVKDGKATIWNQGWAEIPLCLGWLTGRREEKGLKDARDIIDYIWRKPTSIIDDSLMDKCWV